MKRALLTTCAIIALLAGGMAASAQTKEQTGISRDTTKQTRQEEPGATQTPKAQRSQRKSSKGKQQYQYRSSKESTGISRDLKDKDRQ
jgi:Ni/Co efflux regulator RcnB